MQIQRPLRCARKNPPSGKPALRSSVRSGHCAVRRCAVYQFQKVISFTREPRIRLQKWRENLKLFSLKMATAKQLGVYCGLTISRGSLFSKILRLHYSLEFYLSSWSQNIFEECFKFFDIRTWPLQTQKVVTTTRSTLEVHSHNRRSHKWRKDSSRRRKIVY